MPSCMRRAYTLAIVAHSRPEELDARAAARPRSSRARGRARDRPRRDRDARARRGARADRVAGCGDRGFFAAGGERLVADLYLGYGLSSTIRRGHTPAPPEPCPLPLAACSVRPAEYVVEYDNTTETAFVRRLAADLEPAPSTPPRSGASGCDRARRRLPGQPRAAPLRAVRGRRRRARRPSPRPESTQPRALPRRRLGDRLRLAGALPGAARPPRLDVPDQGDAPGRGSRRARGLGQGRGRARDDRRPRAQRPLAHLRARERALARADGDAGAGRGRAHGLDRRGNAARRGRPGRDARGDVPRRLDHGGPEDRGRRPDRGDRARRARRVDGRARPGLRQRRPRPGADDPHLRDRGGAHPPLGRRRRRLGLRSAGGDRRVVDEGRSAARARSAHRRSSPARWRDADAACATRERAGSAARSDASA